MKKLHYKILTISILFTVILFSAFSAFSSNNAAVSDTEPMDTATTNAFGTTSPSGITSPTGITSPVGITSPAGITNPSGITSPAGITNPSGITSPSGINVPAVTVSLQSVCIDNNKCYYTIADENGDLKYFEANYKNGEISASHEIKKPKEEHTIPGSNLSLQRPLPINGYLKGYIAFKKETVQSGSVAYFKGDFSEHLDLFEVGIPEGETIELIFISKDLRYFFYTQKSKDMTRLMAYDLVQNQETQISETGKNYIVESCGKGFAIYQATLQSDSNTPVLLQLDAADWFYSDENRDIKTCGYDTVILNGIIIDPETETMKFGYNVGIVNDKISVVTKQCISGREKIDATGLVVSPGFIDMLAFNITATAAKYKVTDGVTTCLSMHGCTADFGSFFKSNGKNPPLVNYGGALFAIKLRRELGIGDYSRPTKSQIDHMARRAREEIKKGAIAVAFSPEYYPGTSPDEIRAIMKVAREYNIPTHFHGRYSSVEGEHTGIDTVKEILGYAKELDAAVHFMHLHSCGGTGCMDEALQMIDKARSEGCKVTYDIYPYDSWASRLNMARFGGDWQNRFGISYSDLQIPTKAKGLTVNSFAQYKSKGALCIAYAMDDNEVIAALKEDYCMIGSDDAVYTEGGANSHPRASGTFSRVIGRYSRELDAFSLMDALQKLTINSAKHLEGVSPAMKIRERLREGFVADLTLFDYFRINDRSTALAPAITSAGIPYVIISGQTVLDKKGLHMSERSGKPIKAVISK